jgi:hypothetical protein
MIAPFSFSIEKLACSIIAQFGTRSAATRQGNDTGERRR